MLFFNRALIFQIGPAVGHQEYVLLAITVVYVENSAFFLGHQRCVEKGAPEQIDKIVIGFVNRLDNKYGAISFRDRQFVCGFAQF